MSTLQTNFNRWKEIMNHVLLELRPAPVISVVRYEVAVGEQIGGSLFHVMAMRTKTCWKEGFGFKMILDLLLEGKEL